MFLLCRLVRLLALCPVWALFPLWTLNPLWALNALSRKTDWERMKQRELRIDEAGRVAEDWGEDPDNEHHSKYDEGAIHTDPTTYPPSRHSAGT